MQLHLVRHTAVAIPSGICYGASEVELSAKWQQHFSAVQTKLPTINRTTRVHSSPLQRCARLARWLSNNVTLDPRLQEINFGHWEMQPWTQIATTELSAWADDVLHFVPPGGESLQQLGERCRDFISAVEAAGDEQVIVITHAGVIAVIVALYLQLGLQQSCRLRIDYGGATLIHSDAQTVTIDYINR